jgi:excisionase family DNA binding protein
MSSSPTVASQNSRRSQPTVTQNDSRTRGHPATIGVGSTRGLLRVEEAAEWLGLGRTKAYELVYRGILPSVTIGRSRRVPVAALHAFVERLSAEGGWS